MLPMLCRRIQLCSKYSNCINIIQHHKYALPLCNNVSVHFHTNMKHSQKHFFETENTYLYKTLPTQIYDLQTNPSRQKLPINNIDDLYVILDKNWRLESASSIVNGFWQIQEFCSENDINISDSHFDKLVDGLMDHVEKLTDQEMVELLQVLGKFPKTDSFQSHNFHDVWSALDDTCCDRIALWNRDMIFRVADLWFELHCGKLCDFVFEMLDKLIKQTKHMNADDLVRCFFYFSVQRRKKIEFAYEDAVRSKIDSMSLDQMAIIALGFFKTECRIKLPEIINCMIEAVIKNKSTVDGVTLCGILKAVRLSANIKSLEHINVLMNELLGEIDRISWQCVLHMALLGTTMQIYHPEVIEKCCKRFLNEYAQGNTDIRLKDIERLLIPVTMFNHTTESGEAMIKTAFDDLHMPYRRKEMVQYSRCAPSALLFCSMRGLYSHPLMDRYINKDFLIETYGKGRAVSREIFALDVSIDVDCPEYPSNNARLGLKERKKTARWLCERKPTEIPHNPTALELIALDIAEHISPILGGRDKYLWLHVLPHYAKADLILCKNLVTNEFIPPPLNNFELGDVIKAPSFEGGDKLQFYAIVLLGWNHMIRRTNIPLGLMETKRTQLIKVGYKPIYIIWSEFKDLTSENKTKYLKMLLN